MGAKMRAYAMLVLRVAELRLRLHDLRPSRRDVGRGDVALSPRLVDVGLARQVLGAEALGAFERGVRGLSAASARVSCALAAVSCARFCSTLAPSSVGSISASTSPFFTCELKSTKTLVMRPRSARRPAPG